jgi:hypothetical protein
MKQLDLKLHPYAVLQHGERVAFFTNIVAAAQIISWRGGGGVENLVTGQKWSRFQCLDIAGIKQIGMVA